MPLAVVRDVTLEVKIYELVQDPGQFWDIAKLTRETGRPRRRVEIAIAALEAQGKVELNNSVGNAWIVRPVPLSSPPPSRKLPREK